jgi:hypothetical protein
MIADTSFTVHEKGLKRQNETIQHAQSAAATFCGRASPNFN